MFGPEKRKFFCCPKRRKPRIRPRRRERLPATRRTRNSSSRYGTASVFSYVAPERPSVFYIYRERWIVYFTLDTYHKSLILCTVPRSYAGPNSVCHFWIRILVAPLSGSQPPIKDSKPCKSYQIGSFPIHFGMSSAH
jgi:hypothetical protein